MMKASIFVCIVSICVTAVGVDINPPFDQASVKRYKAAADSGDAKSQYLYSKALANGLGGEKNLMLSAQYAIKAAEQSYGYAYYRVGQSYAEGWCGETNVTKASTWYVRFHKWAARVAEQGDAEAQNLLGCCYLFGYGTATNYEMAVEWYTKAAKQGHAFAQRNLSRCLNNGIGIERNVQTAEFWLRQAAEAADPITQFELGRRNLVGENGTKNIPQAILWFQKASAHGSVEASWILGTMYLSGDLGVQRDVEKAAAYLLNPATVGNANAQFLLGVCNLELDGSGHGPDIAVMWFLKGAEQGNSDAMCALGACYEDGSGVAKDTAAAVKWYRMSAKKGNATAIQSLIRLDDDSPEARTGAEQLVGEGKSDADKASFSIRGFYVGMKLEYAKVLLKQYFPKGKIEYTTNTAKGFEKAIILNGLNMHFCDADEKGIVKRISLDKKILRAWFKDAPKDQDEWWQWFAEKNGLKYKSEIREGEKRISNPMVLEGRLLGHATVSQKCFTCTSKNGVIIRYFGKKKADDLSPHWSNADDAAIAGTVMAGRDVAAKWHNEGWENMDGGAEGSLRIEADASEPEGDEWTTN